MKLLEQCLVHRKCPIKVTNYKDNNGNKDVIPGKLGLAHRFCLHIHPHSPQCLSLGASELTISQAYLSRISDFTDEETSSEELNDLFMNIHIRV